MFSLLSQDDAHLFNRGALLNAAVLLLQGSAYDYYVFQDVDTIPVKTGGIRYDFPSGAVPLHLTPYGIHPKATYEDFFGGILVITHQQFSRVNGFGTAFWGWGREDDNLRERLRIQGMWPPQYPEVMPGPNRHKYFKHQKHDQATELRGKLSDNGADMEYYQADPKEGFQGAKIMSSQPTFLADYASGLNTTSFRLERMSPWLGATLLSVRLACDRDLTPWCDPLILAEHHTSVLRARIAAKAAKVTQP